MKTATRSKVTRLAVRRAALKVEQWSMELDHAMVAAHDDGWTQAELAEAMGVAQQTVSDALARARRHR